METVLDFLDFDKNENSFIIEGYHLLSGNEKATAEPCLVVNDKQVPCEKIKRSDKVTVSCEKEVSQRIGFRAAFAADDDKITIRPSVKKGGIVVESAKFHYGKYFPVSDVYR